MKLYIIEHADATFTGFRGGVDFHAGRGSTSSRADALTLAGKGCRVTELGTHTQAGEGEASPSPVILSPTPAEIAAEAKWKADLAAEDAIERNPDSEWSKRKAQAADAKKKRRGRRK